MKQFNEVLSRIPFTIIALLVIGWFSYNYYDFLNSNESELGAKKAQLATAKSQLEASKKRLLNGEAFFKGLESTRTRIVSLSQHLDSQKATITGEVDLANFIRMITLEAKKVGLNIRGIKPETEIKREYFAEIPFNISMKGAYVQTLVFFDRITRLQQLVRVSGFSFKPVGNTLSKFVELEGDGTIVTYRYLASSADEVTKQDWMKGDEEGLKRIQDIKGNEGKK